MMIPISQCVYCKRLRKDWTCDAFPEGIPDAVAASEHDHREPYEGDHGIRFEPVDDKAAEVVDELFAPEPEE